MPSLRKLKSKVTDWIGRGPPAHYAVVVVHHAPRMFKRHKEKGWPSVVKGSTRLSELLLTLFVLFVYSQDLDPFPIIEISLSICEGTF